MNYRILEKYRETTGPFKSDRGDFFGFFFIPQTKIGQPPLKVMLAPLDDREWLHASVSLPTRCPTWEEMCKIKDLFFGEDVCAVQFHPKKEDNISNHPYCLHIWVKVGEEFPMPPSICVGVK